MVICVAGMHRSGTSMVTRLLNRCGVDLGPESALLPPDCNNRDGYWEHRDFLALNEALLEALGGGWNAPPTTSGDWWTASDLAPLRAAAAALVARFADRPCWGWKDPRNSLTLPFWRGLLPDLKVVVCVRSPLEVVGSMRRRGDGVAPDTGLRLWLAYYDRLLEALDTDDRLVTHFDAYAHDAAAELRRLVASLGIDADEPTIRSAVEGVNSALRHEHAGAADAFLAIGDPDIADCYLELCTAAGPVFRAAVAVPPAAGVAPPVVLERRGWFPSGALRQRIARLEARAAEREQTLAAISDRTLGLEEELRALAVVTAAKAEASAERAAALAAEVTVLTHSRGWRLLERLWRVRLGLAPSGSRREQMFLKLAALAARPDPDERTQRGPRGE